MKQAMVEHSSSASHSFLLDDDSTLPFVANEILAQMDDKVSLRCCMRCVFWQAALLIYWQPHVQAITQGAVMLRRGRIDRSCVVLFVTHVILQDLYVALPVPEPLRSGENAGSFAFLEKELRISQM